jgi:hypothetical protein
MRVFPLWRTSKELRFTCEPGLATPNTIVFPQPWEREIRLHYQLLFSAPYHTHKKRDLRHFKEKEYRGPSVCGTIINHPIELFLCAACSFASIFSSTRHNFNQWLDKRKRIPQKIHLSLSFYFSYFSQFKSIIFHMCAQVHQAWAHLGSSVMTSFLTYGYKIDFDKHY